MRSNPIISPIPVVHYIYYTKEIVYVKLGSLIESERAHHLFEKIVASENLP